MVHSRMLAWIPWLRQRRPAFEHKQNQSKSLKYVLQREIAKNSLKTPIFGVQGHRCWYHWKARQQCLLWCAASLSATVLVLEWTTVAETARFEGGTQIWSTRMEDPFNLGGQTLHSCNIRLMPNISYAGCPGLCWMVSVQFTLKMCIAAWNHEKFTKTPIFGVQGHQCWYRVVTPQTDGHNSHS